MSHVLLIGIGNEYRGDDGLGPLVAREMQRRSLPGVDVREESGEGASLMGTWEAADHVVIVDAVASGAVPGTLHRFDARTCALPATCFHSSSHAFGLVEAVELARRLDQLPRTLIVYGIEGELYDLAAGLSNSVLRSVPELIRHLEEEIRLLSVN